MLPNFDEYFNDKKKLIEKPDSSAEFKGSIPNTPPQGGKPYSNPGSVTTAPKYEKGLGDEGDLLLKMPDQYAASKELPTWPKSGRTDEWLSATRNMTLKELAQNAADITVENLQAIQKIVSLVNDPVCLQTLVFECKRAGVLTNLLSQMLTVNETYVGLVKLLNAEQGEEISQRLGLALTEGVGPPAHKDEEDMDVGTDDLDDSDKDYTAGMEDAPSDEESLDSEEEGSEFGDEESGEEEGEDSEFEDEDSEESDEEDDDPRSDPDHPDHIKKILGIDQDGTVPNDDEEGEGEGEGDGESSLAHHRLRKAMGHNPNLHNF